MKGLYLLIDEFNTIILANLIAWKLKSKNPGLKLATVCHKEYDVLFSQFDLKMYYPESSDTDSPVNSLAGNTLKREQAREHAKELFSTLNIELLESDNYSQEVKASPDEPIHFTVLVNSIQYLLDVGPMIYSNNEDKVIINDYLENLGIKKNPYVVIGRFRKVHPQYNNLLKVQILKNLFLGRDVVNATHPSPNLPYKTFFPRYHELPSNLSSYGFSVALMEKAAETTVTGNAGGVGIHMMTSANLRIIGLMNWVNGANFSYNGISLFQARKMSGLGTKHSWLGESPKGYLGMIKRYLKSHFHRGG
jgi:hypothetical protein